MNWANLSALIKMFYFCALSLIKEIDIEFLHFVNKVEVTLKFNLATSSQHTHVMFLR